MNGQQRLKQIDISTPRMESAMPGLPMDGTTMVRLLRVTNFGLGGFFEPVFRSLDLTDNSFHVLCLLISSESKTASPSQLAEMTGNSRANMTRIIEELVQYGWVAREVEARDARRYLIALTPSGFEKVHDTVPKITESINRAFSDLSAEELALLNRLLRKLIVSFDKGGEAMRSVA